MTTRSTLGRRSALLMALAVAACGEGEDDGAAPARASSTTVPASTAGPVAPVPSSLPPSTTSMQIPDWDALCAAGIERAQQELTTMQTVRILEAADSSAFCIAFDGLPGAAPIPLGDEPVSGDDPELRSAGSSGAPGLYHLFALPGGFPAVTARNEESTPLLTAVTADGRHLLILDIGVSSRPEEETMVSRRWTLAAADGAVVAEIEVFSPPAGSAPTSPLETLACLRRAGLDLPDIPMIDADGQGPSSMPPTTSGTGRGAQPFPPQVAATAWAGCRELAIEALRDEDPPAADITQLMSFLDCMAEQGWIQQFLGEITDRAAHQIATATCEGRPPRDDIAITCDAYVIGADGTIAPTPIRTAVRGNLTAARIEAPATSTAGQPFVVDVPGVSLRLADAAETFAVVAQRDFVRTFQVVGGAVTAGSAAYLTPTPADVATSETALVRLASAASGAGGTDFTFAPARFEVVGSTPGTDVTVSLVGHESTLDLSAPDGSALSIRVWCSPDPNVLATTTLTP